jgi:hypothetical protein
VLGTLVGKLKEVTEKKELFHFQEETKMKIDPADSLGVYYREAEPFVAPLI